MAVIFSDDSSRIFTSTPLRSALCRLPATSEDQNINLGANPWIRHITKCKVTEMVNFLSVCTVPRCLHRTNLTILNENLFQQQSLNFPWDFKSEEIYASMAGSHGRQECCVERESLWFKSSKRPPGKGNSVSHSVSMRRSL